MPPDAPTEYLTDDAGIEQVFGRCGVNARLDANRNRQIGVDEEEIRSFAKSYGTEFVLAWCVGRYDASQLGASWLVYWWASVIAAYNLSIYRCGSIPASLQAEYEATSAILEKVQNGQFRLAHLPSKSGTGASLDNVRLDPRYRVKQQRVVAAISEGPPQRSPRREDITANIVAPLERDT